MKKKKIIGAIVAASLATGVAFANQTDSQSESTQPGSPRAQEQQSVGQQNNSQAEQNAQAAQGQSQSSSSSSINEAAGANNASFDKQKFIREAAEGGMAEINMGQIATQKGQDPAVKELGQRLVTDHTKANEQLKELAQKEGVTMPTAASPKEEKTLEHISSLSGSEFDKAFAMHAVRDHKKDIQKFEQAAQSGDPEVSQFAKETLPTLREHLQMAEKIAPNRSAGNPVQEPSGAQPDQSKSSSDQNQGQQSQPSDSSSSGGGTSSPK